MVKDLHEKRQKEGPTFLQALPNEYFNFIFNPLITKVDHLAMENLDQQALTVGAAGYGAVI